jgi:hypothetical protein
VFNSAEYARWQIDYVGEFDADYYDQKLRYALSTLPPKNEMHRWLEYELGEIKMYGMNFLGFQNETPIPWPEAYDAAKANLWCVITVHNYTSAEYYKNYWPTIQHVCLRNSEQFARKNVGLKCGNSEYDVDWNKTGRNPKGTAYFFNIDDTIYNEGKFLNQVGRLYEYLGFDDFQRDLVKSYYQKYIELHL